MIFESLQNAVLFLAKGGVVMIFILLCSIAAVILIVQRWLVLRADTRQTKALRAPLLEAITQDQYERVATLTDNHPCALSHITKVALQNRTIARQPLQEIMTDEARRQEARLNRFLPTIGTIASISPLLGLLGTVTGMIQIFSRLADEYNAGSLANPGMLAGGLWEALLTTAAGLCVAIPTFMFHRGLNASLDCLMLNLEEISALILQHFAPAPQNPSTATPNNPSKKNLS